MTVIGLINHGCAKNLIDSELMLGMLADAGYETTLDDTQADIVIINTCSFIHDAEEESVRSIVETIDSGKKVIVTGCLPQKHKQELIDELPEVVAFLGTSDIKKIIEAIQKVDEENVVTHISESPKYIYPESVERQQITVGASTYIKIAEGCDYRCGYCIIPALRGPYISRPIENILNEAKSLVKKGVSEIILIAQDTTNYGKDLANDTNLVKLLQKLNEIEGLGWIRVMYAYPSLMSDELIKAFATLDKVVKYIDVPLQHSHPKLLKSMRRPAFDYMDMINKLRDEIEGVAIRSTFIVGYPGETQEQFEHLYDFIKKARFDKMGVFEYSKEKNTLSYEQSPHIEDAVKLQRKDALMQLQQGISLDINQSLIGKAIPSIVETINEEGVMVARTYRDAPDIDGLIYIESEDLFMPGDIINPVVKNADEYDLFGEI